MDVFRKAISFINHRGGFDFLSDELYLKLIYWQKMGKKLNLNNPKRFNEKLQWLKLHDRKPEYSVMVDKYEVKNFVTSKIGSAYVIPTLGVWDKFEDVYKRQLDDNAVVEKMGAASRARLEDRFAPQTHYNTLMRIFDSGRRK